MASPKKRRAPRVVPTPRPPRPAAPMRAAAEAQVERTGGLVSWRHCLMGFLAGEALLLLLSNVGLGVANAAFGPAPNTDGGIVGVTSLVSVIFGAYLAARLAGRDGLWQGIVVAIGFIAVGALFQFLQEANIVHSALASGSHQLVDLGPMNMGSVFSGDLIALFGGTFGGLLSRKGPSLPPSRS